ncbi:MAG: hypothetical protein A2Y62_13950 [Candidatus Fischerbacteria bacterium RBG_13_37_8]|uniref:CMP/dCMP-type deaminase domain-containing protein n=1 Tax=Candidatus Fischerbacteria bacterium RBG_13_37_8 TaxID=1817863 RepID=A0A1F5V6L2_9BACT|nr:MAG: hypothetical protein A2Y62_13950 [Candidatus Fischerbacteria bacterium RBG_13_37_8]
MSSFDPLLIIVMKEAAKAYKNGDIPVGAVIFKDNRIISKAYNKAHKYRNATFHAEMLAISKACKKLNQHRLDGYHLLTTLEPCSMCGGAIVLAHIETVHILARDPKAGACGSVVSIIPNSRLNHRPVVQWHEDYSEYQALLRQFFRQLRKAKK